MLNESLLFNNMSDWESGVAAAMFLLECKSYDCLADDVFREKVFKAHHILYEIPQIWAKELCLEALEKKSDASQ